MVGGRISIISRVKLQQNTMATHNLEETLTGMISRLEFAAKHYSHSPTGMPRTGTISRLELQ